MINVGENAKEDFINFFLTEHRDCDQKEANSRRYAVELGNYKHTINVTYDVMRQIVSTCNKIICELKTVCDAGFGYDELLSYIDDNGLDITTINDCDDTGMLWQQKLDTVTMQGLIADINRICKLSESQIDPMTRCLIKLLVNCYIAIAYDCKKNDQIDVIDYLNLMVITVTEIWSSGN